MTNIKLNNQLTATPVGNAAEINKLLRRYGVKFGIYKNGIFKEQLFPFDPIPRIISAEDFAGIEKGLIQRVDALNKFLFDIYHEKNIIKDNVVPEDFVYISSGYLPQCEGITPPNEIYSHISGIDLVQGKDGEWYILEDNLRIPSGASYPLIARELTRIASPDAFASNDIVGTEGGFFYYIPRYCGQPQLCKAVKGRNGLFKLRRNKRYSYTGKMQCCLF